MDNYNGFTDPDDDNDLADLNLWDEDDDDLDDLDAKVYGIDGYDCDGPEDLGWDGGMEA